MVKFNKLNRRVWFQGSDSEDHGDPIFDTVVIIKKNILQNEQDNMILNDGWAYGETGYGPTLYIGKNVKEYEPRNELPDEDTKDDYERDMLQRMKTFYRIN